MADTVDYPTTIFPFFFPTFVHTYSRHVFRGWWTLIQPQTLSPIMGDFDYPNTIIDNSSGEDKENIILDNEMRGDVYKKNSRKF